MTTHITIYVNRDIAQKAFEFFVFMENFILLAHFEIGPSAKTNPDKLALPLSLIVTL